MSDILTLAEAINNLADAVRNAGSTAPAPQSPLAEVKADAKPARAARQSKPKDEKPAEPEVDPTPAEPSLDAAEIKRLVYAVNNEKGRDVINKLLADFGATGASSIKPADYEDFATRANAILNDEESSLD